MTDPLLGLLSERPGGRVSGGALARVLGLTRAGVHKRVRRLRERGFRIDGASRLGYRLDGAPDRLEAGPLKNGWVTEAAVYDTLPSTQDEVKARAIRGAPEGTLVVAERQTAGRGRRGRGWASPAGGLWFSLLLRPPLPPSAMPALTLVAALAWARAVEARGVPVGLKWPNDLWVGDKKLGGFLMEMSAEPDRVHWAVLGVGLNVLNDAPRDTPVPGVSLKDVAAGPVDRTAFLAEGLARFTEAYRVYRARGFAPFRAECHRRLLFLGRRVRYEAGPGFRVGRVAGVDGEGRLRLETPGGTVTIAGGDVSRLRLNS